VEPSGGPSCLLRRNDFAVKMGRVVSTTERDIIRYYYYFVQQTERGLAFLRCESSSYDTARHRRGDERLAWGRGKSSGFRTGGPGGGTSSPSVRRSRGSPFAPTDRPIVVVVVIGAVVVVITVVVQQPQTQTAWPGAGGGPGARMSCTAPSRSPSRE